MSELEDEVGKRTSSFSGGGNFFENLVSDLASSTATVLTGGDMYYKDGKLQGTPFGNLKNTVGEALGDITGRNEARKANMDAKQNLVEEKAARDQESKNNQAKAMQNDINASNYAGAVRSSADQQTRRLLGGSDLSKDFLGL